jgi:hypothetical protein
MRTFVLTCLLVQAAAATTTSAFADDKAACLDAVAKGQTLRDEHKLVEARDSFRFCARSVCPAVVQSDCVGFLEAVEKNLPSVVFTAKDGAGADLVDVQVTADGQPLVTKLDGAAVPIDPGPHTFVFTSGAVASKRTATILEGARNQIVSATLSAPPPAPMTGAAPSTTIAAPAARASPTQKSSGSWLPVTAIAVGGVGLATGVVLTVLAHGKRTDGDNLCPNGMCPDAEASQIASLDSDATTFGQIAATSFIVGGVALATGIVLLIVRGHHAARSDTAHVLVLPTGVAGVF